ncbi:D-2-hydroxyacid dehydrogenase [Halomonas mongoliensis]|uniref:D-2-hydroxyacid dehydrogenase n=1 Tax=Halomonas mongoliensis TaxID=321265 RepID=UPI00403B31A6
MSASCFLNKKKYKELRVAVNIDPQRNELVIDMIRRSSSRRKLPAALDFKACASLDQITEFRPDILVSHENESLKHYLNNGGDVCAWLHIMSSGVDGLVSSYGDMLHSKGVRVSNVKGIHGVAMREYVITMMLYFEKDMQRWMKQKEDGVWSRGRLSSLYGKTLLIYGAGSIGQAVAEAASFFGCYVIGVSRTAEKKEFFDEMVKPESLIDAVGSADYVLISAPKTSKTYGAFGCQVIDCMKPEAVLVNISRGGVVNENYLLSCVESGRIRGAALDVFQEEPLPRHAHHWSIPNLIITPHVAGAFESGMELGVDCFLDNLAALMSSGSLITEVSLINGY